MKRNFVTYVNDSDYALEIICIFSSKFTTKPERTPSLKKRATNEMIQFVDYSFFSRSSSTLSLFSPISIIETRRVRRTRLGKIKHKNCANSELNCKLKIKMFCWWSPYTHRFLEKLLYASICFSCMTFFPFWLNKTRLHSFVASSTFNMFFCWFCFVHFQCIFCIGFNF